MISLSQLFAENTLNYLSGNYSGSHRLSPAINGEAEYELPAVIIGANSFTEISPGAGVYQGILSVGIYTQIDEVENANEIHDSTANHIHSLISDTGRFLPGFNGNEKGTLWGVVHTSFNSSLDDRYILTVSEFNVFGQTSAV